MSFQIPKKQVKKSTKEWSNLRLLNNKLMRQDKDTDLLHLEHLYYSSAFWILQISIPCISTHYNGFQDFLFYQ